MSTQQNGLPAVANGAIATLAAPVNIASSTNATPIQITTSTPHGLTNGDAVSIQDHQVNTNANGSWIASVTSATQFTIASITGVSAIGNGVGAATGLVVPRSFGATMTVPADGVDNLAAASVNVPFEAVADRTSLLLYMTGQYKLASITFGFADDATISGNDAWETIVVPSANVWVNSTATTLNVSGVQNGDIIVVEWSTSAAVAVTSNTFSMSFSLFASNKGPGVAASYAYVGGSAINFFTGSTSSTTAPLKLTGTYFATVSGNVRFAIAAAASGASTGVLTGSWQFLARVFRPTGINQ